MRTRPAFLLGSTLLALAIVEPPLRAEEATVVVFSGPTMGTRYTVRVAGPPLGQSEREAVSSLIEHELSEADRLLSTWNPESEISRFNRHASTAPFEVDAVTLSVIDIARRVSEMSGGAFDVTVAPLVAAWGFGAGAHGPSVPEASELARLREGVGFGFLRLDRKRRTLAKARPDVSCDLSGLVPGFVADRIVEGLARLGHANVIVDIGGEVAARGRRADGAPWRVAVESPGGGPPAVVVALEDAAVATSGDYRNYWRDAGGRRLSHIIDPRTGEPIDHGLASVSVVHHDAAWADALATALLVKGPDAGKRLATEQGLGARFVVREPSGEYVASQTPQFDALVIGAVRR